MVESIRYLKNLFESCVLTIQYPQGKSSGGSALGQGTRFHQIFYFLASQSDCLDRALNGAQYSLFDMEHKPASVRERSNPPCSVLTPSDDMGSRPSMPLKPSFPCFTKICRSFSFASACLRLKKRRGRGRVLLLNSIENLKINA